MINLNHKTETEIQRFLDKEIYGDELRNTNWAKNLTHGLLNKKPHLLAEYISHGKGFNDSSKKAVCLLLETKPVYTQKAIDELLAKHCDISLEKFLLERELSHDKHNVKNTIGILQSNFSNSNVITDWVQDLFNKGYNKIITQGNKSFIANADERGYPLKRAAVRKYAEAFIKQNETQDKLNALAA
ncbi:hypothetical protein [Pseudoalteromonas marina]|uniref:Uncharacterized protein n=1 Tax=Pseudoalteromonas marina TaxID=267375 RepID=A0ABT9FCA6_9GAMM|nr:hypothetical protein [Pseudoalteromonas marina]MDP2564421.1 hypothetical protein [Pseudoalteromonas marina]